LKLICIDLEAPMPAVPPCTEGEQWVLVRLHGEPLGMLSPPRNGCTAAELGRMAIDRFGWAASRHLVADCLGQGSPAPDDLSSIPSLCPHARETAARVTVAVCTRNRASQLAACLDALIALDYPAPLLDILVVDNAPADGSTRELVAAYPAIRYVCEPRPGLDNARNRAIAEARGEILAYTDDDVSVDRGWIAAVARAFEEEPHAMCVTGLVVPDELDTRAQLLFERYGGFNRGYQRSVYRIEDRAVSAVKHYGGTGRFGTGANMAFRARFFAEHGLFDPHLDVGTPANGGGDLEIFLRVLKHGHALVYEPAAMVRHRHRRSYTELRAQIANNGVGFYAYLVRTARAYPDERGHVVRLGVWWLWWWNLRRLAAALAGRGPVPLDLVLAELKGSFVGLSRYRSQGVS
jgi:glycosyltransferase involved in cell wall biosynthesis